MAGENSLEPLLFSQSGHNVMGMVAQSKPQQPSKRQPQREKLARQDLSTEETLRRLRTIDQWRKKQLATFKKRYPDHFKDQA